MVRAELAASRGWRPLARLLCETTMIAPERLIGGALALLWVGRMRGGCATARRDAREHPAIIILPDATNVRWADIYDGQVTYSVSEPYPANRAIREIQTKLQQLGWRPRKRDLLNPAGSSGTRAEWIETDIEGKPAIAWSQQWEHDMGDVVWYGLRYWSKSKNDVATTLDILVSYFSKDTVTAIESDIRRKKQ